MIFPFILNRFPWNFAKVIFYSNLNRPENFVKLYSEFQKLDHLTCSKFKLRRPSITPLNWRDWPRLKSSTNRWFYFRFLILYHHLTCSKFKLRRPSITPLNWRDWPRLKSSTNRWFYFRFLIWLYDVNMYIYWNCNLLLFLCCAFIS